MDSPSKNNKVFEGEVFPIGHALIAPSDVAQGTHYWNAFGHSEAETSARWIVGLCRDKGGWFPFTRAELNERHQAKCSGDFRFNGLAGCCTRPAYLREDAVFKPADHAFLVLGDDGLFRVTDDFIIRVYRSAPVKSEAA